MKHFVRRIHRRPSRSSWSGDSHVDQDLLAALLQATVRLDGDQMLSLATALVYVFSTAAVFFYQQDGNSPRQNGYLAIL